MKEELYKNSSEIDELIKTYFKSKEDIDEPNYLYDNLLSFNDSESIFGKEDIINRYFNDINIKFLNDLKRVDIINGENEALDNLISIQENYFNKSDYSYLNSIKERSINNLLFKPGITRKELKLIGDLNELDFFCKTSLTYALEYNLDYDIIHFLLENGANPLVYVEQNSLKEYQEKQTPLIKCLLNSPGNIIDLMLKFTNVEKLDEYMCDQIIRLRKSFPNIPSVNNLIKYLVSKPILS